MRKRNGGFNGIPSRQDDVDDETITHDCGGCRGGELAQCSFIPASQRALPEQLSPLGRNGANHVFTLSISAVYIYHRNQDMKIY
jgi:hypothetical protein